MQESDSWGKSRAVKGWNRTWSHGKDRSSQSLMSMGKTVISVVSSAGVALPSSVFFIRVTITMHHQNTDHNAPLEGCNKSRGLNLSVYHWQTFA